MFLVFSNWNKKWISNTKKLCEPYQEKLIKWF